MDVLRKELTFRRLRGGLEDPEYTVGQAIRDVDEFMGLNGYRPGQDNKFMKNIYREMLGLIADISDKPGRLNEFYPLFQANDIRVLLNAKPGDIIAFEGESI